MRVHEIIILLLLGTALLFGLGYEGFASHGLPRAVAYLLVAMAGAMALVFSAKNINVPQKCMALFFLIPILAGGALMLPLPVDLVTYVSRHWADWVTAREATGLPPVTSIPLALDFEAGTRAINLWIAAGAMFLASVAVCRSRVGLASLTYLVVAIGLFEGSLAFLAMAMGEGEGRARGILVNPNHSAALILMTLPIAGALVYRRGLLHGRNEKDYLPRRINDVWIIPMSFIAVATLGWFATVSRASLAIGVLVLLPWVLWELRIILMHDVLLRRRQIYAIIAGGFAMALLVLWFAGAPESIAERIDRPAEGFGRLDLWAATWQGLLDSNFIGLGLGGANVALEMGLQDVATRKAPGWTHNDWLQYVSDLGILGAVLSVIWLVAFAAAVRKTTVWTGSWWISRRHLIDRAIVVGVASVLIHSLVDFPLRIPLVGFCFLALMAILLARLNLKESAPTRAA